MALKAYADAGEATSAALAQDSARMLIGRIASALAYDPSLDSGGAIATVLRDAVTDGRLTREHAESALRRILAPSVDAVAKALAPLRGLLARLDEEPRPGTDGPTGMVVVAAKDDAWGQTP